jgi:protocatechuate 3,4-dioxygenase beta subunit
MRYSIFVAIVFALTFSAAGRGGDDPTSSGSVKTWVLAGVCQDEKSKPLASVQVTIYRQDLAGSNPESLGSLITLDDGRFRFADLAPIPASSGNWIYVVAFTKKGRGSIVLPFFDSSFGDGALRTPCEVNLRPAATLDGRVTDSDGKPIAGARVWAHGAYGPLEGIKTARTDADGRFAISDMSATDPEKLKPRDVGNGIQQVFGHSYFDVLHPDYAHERPTYRSIPATVDVTLKPGGIIEGRVIDEVTGRPAIGAKVCMQGTNQGGPPGGGWQQVRTDSNGKYQLTSLLPGTYNVWSAAPERTCAALDSFSVEAKSNKASDLVLVKGSWIEGSVIDANTHKPIFGSKENPLYVAIYGPSRPKSGAAVESVVVDDQGRFRIRVMPGINYPYIMNPGVWERTEQRHEFEKGISVKANEATKIEFRVVPTDR